MSSQKTDYTLFFDSSVPQSAVSSISLHLSFFHILFIFHLTGKKHVSSVYKSHVSFCCCVSFHINTPVIASLVLCSEYTLQHYMYHKTDFFSASLINWLQFTRPPANADFCAKRRKIFFASRFYLTPMWITFVYTHACTLSSDLLADFPCIYMIFPDFPLLFCPVIHTLFFLFIPSSQSFCQPVFFLRSLFFAELFIINLSIQGRFFDE